MENQNERKFRSLLGRTGYTDFVNKHHISHLSPEQVTELSGHLSTLEKIEDSMPLEEAMFVFNFAIPPLMKSSGGGINAVLKFADHIAKGHNPWAACLASVDNPEPFFRRLTEEFEYNKSFAEWLVSPEKAARELWEATKGDPRWDAGEPYEKSPLIQAWKTKIFAPVGKWPEVGATFKDFTLSQDEYALGAEIERRNRDVGIGKFIPEDHEIRTPHTTNLDAFAQYLQNVKHYFVDTQDFFPANHFWNLHLNLSLSTKAHDNIYRLQKAWVGMFNVSEDFKDIARMLLYAGNPYARNVYRENMEHWSTQIHVHSKTPLEKPSHDVDFLLDERCPQRRDRGRLEMKCPCIWAGMDVDYIMGCMKIIHLLTEHPEHIPAFKHNLQQWYGGIMNPDDFSHKPFQENKPEHIAEAETYEKETLHFREAMKARFADIFAELASPAPANFRQKLASEVPEPRARG